MGVVAVGEPGLGDRMGAADAFGHVLAGELKMNASGMGSLRVVHGEEPFRLGEDAVDRARLVAGPST